MRTFLLSAALLGATMIPAKAQAFCGFYVGKAGAELYNHASQVVLVRDGPRTVLTMSNDFQGNLKDFAMVVPVPVVLKKEMIHVNERKLIERIDSYSSPRLVEYFDWNPCDRRRYKDMKKESKSKEDPSAAERPSDKRTGSLGVKIEAEYTVGEYDIVILSAKESDGLETWLKEAGYVIPANAAAALQPYIKQNMKFFVAKVNLKEQKSGGFNYLRPIQIAYESEKFMLPIRLGMANSHGEQDMLVYTLTKTGRVESSNYKTDKVPSDINVPLFVRTDFAKVYPAIFGTAHARSGYRAVHTEYVWDTGWCDPCVDNPLTPDELKGLGVFWLGQPGGQQPVVTRMHIRYDAEHFPENLVFQETGDRTNFQARYILQNKAQGDLSCPAGQEYLKSLDARHLQEAKTLADLTGWKLDDIKKKMGSDAPGASSEGSWYQNLWK